MTHEPEISTTYDDIGVDRRPTIKAQVQAPLVARRSRRIFLAERNDSDGERYQIRSGVVYAEGHGAPFYVAIGVPLAQNATILREFTLDLRRRSFRRALILGLRARLVHGRAAR